MCETEEANLQAGQVLRPIRAKQSSATSSERPGIKAQCSPWGAGEFRRFLELSLETSSGVLLLLPAATDESEGSIASSEKDESRCHVSGWGGVFPNLGKEPRANGRGPAMWIMAGGDSWQSARESGRMGCFRG